MRTISSIEMRAKRSALKRVKDEIVKSIHENIEMLTISIEDEENKNGDLPDDVK